MNEHIKSLYPWARNYDEGGPIKRQNLLAGMKTPEQVASETMSVAENTKTQNTIDATEQRLQASRAQKERIQQQLSQQNAEIKPQNENPLYYASTNPLTQQIAGLNYINEQNPQTWYRPGYDYQQQYFSPETREQAQNDISNFISLLFGAMFPETLPLLAAYGNNELFNDDEQSKQDINTAINTAGFFTGSTHSVRDLFNRGKNVAKNTVEQVKLARNFKPRQITQEGDFVFEPFRGQDENLIGSVFYNNRDLQHKSGSKYGQKNILGRSLERLLRGGAKSDVYVEKSLMDQADLPNVTLNPLKKTSRGFKSTFGKDANPKDYYKVSTEQLLTSKIPTNANEQNVYDAISNQVMPQLKTKASNQAVPVFYNPKTAKSPGSVLRWGLYTLPTTAALGAMTNTTLTGIGQWQDYKNMQNRLQDTDYADFQDIYYDLPQQDRDNISVIVSNYLNNPYELETKQQFDALVNAFEQQYGEKGLRMLDAYVKYQTPSYSDPIQIHPVDATKSFVNDRIYQFSSDNEESNNTFAKGGPKRDKFYNTQLTPQQEQQYQQWVQTLPINLRNDYDYDLRGAWLNGDLPDQNYHMTDKWKKPWHPTFSNESVYSTPGAEGGRWDGEEFHPSNLNRFMQDFKYGEWGANRFSPGGPIEKSKLSTDQQRYFKSFYRATKHPSFDGNNTSTPIPYKLDSEKAIEKIISSPSVWSVWQQSTGLPWSKAKELGYTDGSYIQNMALLHYLQDNDWSVSDWDMYNNDYLMPAIYPHQTAAINAEKDYIERATQNAKAIPFDKNNALRLTNAGNLTGATVPKNLIDSVYKYSQVYNYDPYVILGIAGKETRFGIDDPYTANKSKNDFFLAPGYNPEVRNARTITDMTNNHTYWLSPLRSELNQIARNYNLDYSENYGVPNAGYYPVFYQQDFNKDFDNSRMRTLIQKTYDSTPPNEYQSIIDAYNNKSFSKMDELNQTINLLRQSPELQQYIQSLSNLKATGGSIHIKPANRGKFTAAAKRVGKSVQEYASQILANKDHYSTTLVKRANFAKNAKKFHH